VLLFALRAVFFALRFAAPFREAVLRALVLRDARARERAVRFVLRAALDLRLAAALRLRLLFDFFLPRGGILLLRELGSPGYHLALPTGSVYAIARSAMTKKHRRSKLGVVPPERAPARRPRERGIAPTPKGQPLAQARPTQPTAAAPRERGVAPPPNPRKPQLVHDVHGNELMDLFQFFPDLPRPPRRRARIPARRPRPR
jgi:hypothetical protein